MIQIRREFLFGSIDPAKASVLEIGPSHNPTLPRRDGYNTKNADHLDRAGLADKYKEHTDVLTERIEEVDYVLVPGTTLSAGIEERFDLVLAAHVIEHTTSLVHFINECGRLLTDGGTLALIVPDSRFCFDRFRERSSIGSVIDASLRVSDVHSKGTLTEHALYAANRDGRISWAPGSGATYGWVHDLAETRGLAAQSDSGTYVDVHHWVFTPHHLRLLLHDLAELGYISLREASFHDTVGCEFFLNLRADAPGAAVSRRHLLELSDAERRGLDVPVFNSV